MNTVRNVDVLSFRVVVEFFINRLFAGVGGETGDIKGSTRSGGVGDVGGSGTDTASAKTREEGSTVVLLRYGHRKGIERECGRLGGLFKGCRKRKEFHEGWRARGGTARRRRGG